VTGNVVSHNLITGTLHVWSDDGGGYNGTGIVLRRIDPDRPRPYRVVGYPFTPIVFGAVCLFLIYSAVKYDPVFALVWIGVLLLGIPVYWLSSRRW